VELAGATLDRWATYATHASQASRSSVDGRLADTP
jgi:hypothetical protein